MPDNTNKTDSAQDQQQSDPSGTQAGPNEGEGSQSGAHAYNSATRKFVESGKVSPAADDAVHAVEGPEADELKKAEAEGKSHSHGEDPLLRKGARP